MNKGIWALSSFFPAWLILQPWMCRQHTTPKNQSLCTKPPATHCHCDNLKSDTNWLFSYCSFCALYMIYKSLPYQHIHSSTIMFFTHTVPPSRTSLTQFHHYVLHSHSSTITYFTHTVPPLRTSLTQFHHYVLHSHSSTITYFTHTVPPLRTSLTISSYIFWLNYHHHSHISNVQIIFTVFKMLQNVTVMCYWL